MKKIFSIILIPLFLLLCGSSFESYTCSSGAGFSFPIFFWEKPNANLNIKEVRKENEQKLHKEFNVEEGKTLNIDINSGGSLRIEGWDKNVVSADVESSRNNLDNYDITINKVVSLNVGSGLHFRTY